MALIVKDRVQEISTTVGTGTLTLGGAVLGFQSFAAIGNGNTTYYAINDPVTGDWEAGIGTYTSSGTTLSRDTVLSSSNGGSLVSFASGTKNVFCTYPSERAVYLDSAGSYPVQNTFNALTASSIALITGTITTAPVANTDIVNKQYADAIASGIHFHEAVALATTAALPANTYNNGTSGVGATLTGNANGALSVDSTLTIATERILVKNEAAGAHNGVYVVTQVGSAGTPYILTRATDFDTVGTGVDQIDEGDFFLVTSGVVNLNTAWVQQTAPPITVGTTALVFQQFSAPITYTAGTGLNESPTYTFNIANTSVVAATYGSSSQVPVLTVNAQGQLTTVTNTGIAITSAAVSGLAASATTDTTNANNITSGTLGTSRLSGSYTGITGVGALAAGSLASGFTAVSAPLGGTGQTSYAVGDILYADTTTSLAKLADVAVGNAIISGGVGVAPSYGKIGLATHVSGTLPVANGGTGVTSSTGTGSVVLSNSPTLVTPALGTPASGNLANCTFPTLNQNTTGTAAGLSATLVATSGGTGQSSYAVGDLLFASTTTALSKLADVATGNALISGGVGIAPAYGKIGLTTHVSGTLPLANGGSGQTSAQSAMNTFAGAVTSGQYLRGNGTNVVMSAIQAGDVPTLNQNTTGNAATATNLSTDRTNWSTNGVISAVVGQLAWKNYGNNHTIFDASNSTSPAGGAVNNTNSQIAWAGTYPTLMGWNGANTYGVRVDSARLADNISSQANSATITASVATTANQIVLRDGSGDDNRRYGFAEYFNMSHGVSGATGDTIFYSSTDNYIRKNNATGFRASLNVPTRTGGDASGTWGINITGNAGNASSISNAVGGSYTWTAANAFQSNFNTGSGTNAPLQAYSTGGNGAVMSFHRAGVFAINMGLDSDNVFRIGGWSASTNRLQMDMSGNLTMAGTLNGTGLAGGAATGSGASGTWGISITGNAATATALTTASGSAPSYSARAWVNFNGTGTVAIRASGNVTSITDVGVGKYTVNFTTALPDANYAAALSAKNISGANINGVVAEIGSAYGTAVRTTTALGIVVMDSAAGSADSDSVNVTIFR